MTDNWSAEKSWGWWSWECPQKLYGGPEFPRSCTTRAAYRCGCESPTHLTVTSSPSSHQQLEIASNLMTASLKQQEPTQLTPKCTFCAYDCAPVSMVSRTFENIDEEFISLLNQLGFDIDTFLSLSEELKKDITKGWLPRISPSATLVPNEPLSKPFQISKGQIGIVILNIT